MNNLAYIYLLYGDVHVMLYLASLILVEGKKERKRLLQCITAFMSLKGSLLGSMSFDQIGLGLIVVIFHFHQ